MKSKMKLWLRKRALMVLSGIVWRLDDWVHAQQAKLQNELSERKPSRLPPTVLRAGSVSGPAAARAGAETFQEWEARLSAVAVISKKEARRRRERTTAAMFDRRFES